MDSGFFSFIESPNPKSDFEKVTISDIKMPILEEICEIDSVCFCKAGEVTKDIDRERFLEFRDTIRKWGYYLKIREIVTQTISTTFLKTDIDISSQEKCVVEEHGPVPLQGIMDRPFSP